MNKKVRNLVYAAVLAALYVVLTNLQNILLPGSATWAIQFRASEALCVLALFTPAAIPGLTVGCFLFNLNYANALPLDILVGSLATMLACGAMYLTRNLKIKDYPALAMVMPALATPFWLAGNCRCTSAADSGSMPCMWPSANWRCC